MARIEIPLEEYQGLKKLNEELYVIKTNLEKELEIKQNKINKANELLEEVEEFAFFERLFNWKNLIAKISNFLKNE